MSVQAETGQIEDWMHASDEERAAAHAKWNVAAGEGQEMVKHVASLFSEECVYNIEAVGTSAQDGRWVIDAYVSFDDYENLKNRYNIEFLGFKINFHDIADK